MSEPAPTPPLTTDETTSLPIHRRFRALGVDLISSYVATAARAGAMLLIVAFLSRHTTAGYLAAFLFLRAMLGFLNNVFAGATAAAIAAIKKPLVAPLVESEQEAIGQSAEPLSYESKARAIPVFNEGFDGLLLATCVTAVFAFAVVHLASPLLENTAAPMLPANKVWALSSYVSLFAVGMLARVLSDAMGGVLQIRKLLWLDNLFVSLGEITWVALTWFSSSGNWLHNFQGVAEAYCISGLLLAAVRTLTAALLLGAIRNFTYRIRFDVAIRFLTLVGILAFSSMGDFLYAPANNLIVSKCLDPLLIADYGPALQIDAVILLGVAAIGPVMLPRVVAMYEAKRFRELRHAYLVAMLVGSAILLAGAIFVMIFRDPMLHLWLGDYSPGTRAILPLVLCHTVLGGCNSISRAVMLGLGRFRLYTIGALGGGVINVCLALFFVTVLHLGLKGVVLATILTVTIRCVFWMPWQILRILRADDNRPATA